MLCKASADCPAGLSARKLKISGKKSGKNIYNTTVNPSNSKNPTTSIFSNFPLKTTLARNIKESPPERKIKRLPVLNTGMSMNVANNNETTWVRIIKTITNINKLPMLMFWKGFLNAIF